MWPLVDVAVHQLGRVAHRVRGDGVLAPEVELAVALRRVEHPKAQLGEEGVPEGIQLEHIQAHGDADGAPGAGAGLVRGQQLLFVVVQVVLGGGALLFQGLVAAGARAPFAKVFPVRRQWFWQPLQVMAFTWWVKFSSSWAPRMVLWPRPFSLE